MKVLRTVIFALLATGLANASFAAGTPAGTVVDNRANVTAVLNGDTLSLDSNVAGFTVDEIIDLLLVWQDGASVAALPGDAARILTFRLTNIGNGDENVRLGVNNAIAGDQFDPQNPAIYLDGNGNGSFEAGTDLPYNAANPPLLAADQALTIFVANAIPASAADGDTGISRLTATAATGSGAPGTAFPPVPPGTTDSILGASGGMASADGSYLISATSVNLAKSAQVRDPDGGSESVVGATITYSILVNVTGSQPATGLVVADPIPPDTTYVPGSMRLIDGGTSKMLTDSADGDEGAFGELPVGSGNYQVVFTLGDLTNTTRTLTFQVTIK